MKHSSAICLLVVTIISLSESLPINSDSKVIFVPISYISPNQQPRGPFDFIGNFFQSNGILPIEINVPDTFSAVGNTIGGFATGVGNFAQGVGSNLQGIAQNVGAGIQNFAQGAVQNFPILGAFVRPTGGSTQRLVILVPTQQFNNRPNQNQNVKADFNLNSDILDMFP